MVPPPTVAVTVAHSKASHSTYQIHKYLSTSVHTASLELKYSYRVSDMMCERAAWFYSTSTAVYSLLLTLTLFHTDYYLQAGHSAYLQVVLLLAAAELLKYTYIRVIHYKSIVIQPKPGRNLGSKLVDFIKEIKLVEVIKSGLVLVGCTVVVFFIAILFGAEFLDKHEETLMFSCLITVLTVLPVCVHQGVSGLVHFLNGTQASNPCTQVLLRNIQFTALGAWLGAFVIPLDWERTWQVWPIPCSLGAMLGFTVGQLFSILEVTTKSGQLSKLRHKFR